MLDELLSLKGELRIVLTDEHGGVKLDTVVPNLVTTVGKGIIAERMKGSPSIAAISHMAVGTNNTAANASDTALGAEVAGSRTALTSTAVAGAVITYVCTFGAGVGTGSLTEAGLFNNAAGGSMLCRSVFSTIVKAAGDTLTITWTVTIS